MQSKALGVVDFVNGWQMMMTCSSVPFGLWGHKVFPRVFAVPFVFHQALPTILETILTALAGAGARLPCCRYSEAPGHAVQALSFAVSGARTTLRRHKRMPLTSSDNPALRRAQSMTDRACCLKQRHGKTTLAGRGWTLPNTALRTKPYDGEGIPWSRSCPLVVKTNEASE